MTETRYERNIPALEEQEQKLLSSRRVLVIGCGGLGGFILESLARLGVGHITAVDGDVFEESNLNRQLYSSPALLGQKKAAVAARRIQEIAPDVEISHIDAFFCKENADELVAGQNLVMDALDSIPARLLMEEICEKHGVTFVHGAILGWSLQVAVCRPGNRVMHRLYGEAAARETTSDVKEMEAACKTSLPMTPAACAALQTAEAVKLLTGQTASLDGKLLIFNLKTMEQLTIPV